MPGAEQHTSNRIEALCVERGVRLTAPRRVIARILADAHDHPDVEEVHRRVQAVEPQISLSTVYRALKLFAEKGILERHDFGRGRGRFEAAPHVHHDHLIDIDTGGVIEFRNEDIEALQEAIARQLGFTLVGHKLELYGRRVAGTRRGKGKRGPGRGG